MSTLVLVLLLGGILLVGVGFALTKLRAFWGQEAPAANGLISNAPIDRHVTAILHMRDGMVVSVEKPSAPAPRPAIDLPPSWYKRLRIGVSVGFLGMLLITFFIQSGLADGTLKSLSKSLGLVHSAQALDLHTASHVFTGNASRNLVRISQLDPAQYASQDEFNTWAYSACSTASMTEVFNAYGGHYRITDVLQVEAALGEITPELGLVRPEGIAITAAKFGFKTNWGENWSLDQLISTANGGHPVIISFPPDRYDGGHLLVVVGGDSSNVYLADSSAYNRTALSYDQFLAWWGGYAAEVTPA